MQNKTEKAARSFNCKIEKIQTDTSRDVEGLSVQNNA